MRGQGRCPKGPGGRRAAAGRPPSLRTWPCPTRSDRQPATATRGDSSRALRGSCCCILRARWAAGTPHMPPRPGTAGMERQHATWAAALLGRLPRLPSTRLGQAGRLRTATQQPAMIKPSRFAKKKRASDMEKLQTHPVAIANRNPFVLRLPSLQEPLEIGGQLVLVCSADLRRRVEVQRLLVGHQADDTRKLFLFFRRRGGPKFLPPFSGRFKGVLARARGTWAGVVLGHKAAVLGVMPQAGQPHCGIVSKSTVPRYVLVLYCMVRTW